MNIDKILLSLTGCIIFCFACTASVFAQPLEQIRLLDRDNALPIEGATFEYGEQSGVSDKNGTIKFFFSKDLTMKLSYINYGKWELSDKEIVAMLQQKVYYRESITTSLYPITVIALRPNRVPSKRISLEYEDRMAHDGASILNQNPALNSIRKGGIMVLILFLEDSNTPNSILCWTAHRVLQRPVQTEWIRQPVKWLLIR